MALAWPFKDPEEVLDYQCDWTARLDGDTITVSDWTLFGDDALLNIDSDSFGSAITTIWLSGGTLGEEYLLTNHITTVGARQMEQTMKIKIKAK